MQQLSPTSSCRQRSSALPSTRRRARRQGSRGDHDRSIHRWASSVVTASAGDGAWPAAAGRAPSGAASVDQGDSPLLRLRGIGKSFGPVHALVGIDLDIVQNMLLGHEVRRWYGLLDEVTMEITAKQTLTDLRVTTVRSIRQPVGSLSGGQRQSVAVAKAVMQDARLVIMDEPTAALGVTQTELVLDLIGRLKNRGHAVIVVSHNLNEVFQVADRLAVLYLGGLAAAGPASDFDTQSVVELMTTGASARVGANGNAREPAPPGGRPPGGRGSGT